MTLRATSSASAKTHGGTETGYRRTISAACAGLDGEVEIAGLMDQAKRLAQSIPFQPRRKKQRPAGACDTLSSKPSDSSKLALEWQELDVADCQGPGASGGSWEGRRGGSTRTLQ
jgi:hypothetical protein